MTNREFFNAIVTGTVVLNAGKETETSYSAYGDDGRLIEELTEFASNAIAKMDKKNEAAKGRKTTSKKSNPENDALKERIAAECEPGITYTAKTISEMLEISTQKASALLRGMVSEGTMVAIEVSKNATKEYRLPD